MLKRIVGLVVGTTVACSSFMAFAADVSTTSTYGAETGKISVASEVTGVEEGQTLTYLAYDKRVEDLAKLEGTNIVYIDQVTLARGMEDFNVEATTYTFNYTADTTDIQANVKVGGAVTLSGDTIDGPACSVVVDSGEAVEYAYPADSTGFTLVYVNNVNQIKNVKLNDTQTVVGTDWYLGTEGIYVLNSYLMKANLAIAIEKDTETAASVSTTGIATVDSGTSVIIVGTVTGGSEYGAKITVGEDKELTYPALGKGTDGRFAIKLTGLTVGTKVVAKTYCDNIEGKQCVVTTDATDQVGSIVQ